MAEPSKEQQFQAQIAQLQFDNQSKAKVLAEQANENVNLRIQVTQLKDMLNGVTAQNAELKKKVVPIADAKPTRQGTRKSGQGGTK